MAIVKLKTRWFDPHSQLREPGKQRVPDEWVKQLPAGSEVVSLDNPEAVASETVEPQAENPEPVKGGDDAPKLLLFTAVPKAFKSEVDPERDPIKRDLVVAKALEVFEGNVEAWNELTETERRSKLQSAARALHKDPEPAG
ncbi:MAG: hypothetical protein JKP96_06695 [Oceanicaulis sp.]|jgi:hypothetical protein|nr:hypothetical protein [Oceanicaulis sp.]